jgi:hypothetical protein
LASMPASVFSAPPPLSAGLGLQAPFSSAAPPVVPHGVVPPTVPAKSASLSSPAHLTPAGGTSGSRRTGGGAVPVLSIRTIGGTGFDQHGSGPTLADVSGADGEFDGELAFMRAYSPAVGPSGTASRKSNRIMTSVPQSGLKEGVGLGGVGANSSALSGASLTPGIAEEGSFFHTNTALNILGATAGAPGAGHATRSAGATLRSVFFGQPPLLPPSPAASSVYAAGTGLGGSGTASGSASPVPYTQSRPVTQSLSLRSPNFFPTPANGVDTVEDGNSSSGPSGGGGIFGLTKNTSRPLSLPASVSHKSLELMKRTGAGRSIVRLGSAASTAGSGALPGPSAVNDDGSGAGSLHNDSGMVEEPGKVRSRSKTSHKGGRKRGGTAGASGELSLGSGIGPLLSGDYSAQSQTHSQRSKEGATNGSKALDFASQQKPSNGGSKRGSVKVIQKPKQPGEIPVPPSIRTPQRASMHNLLPLPSTNSSESPLLLSIPPSAGAATPRSVLSSPAHSHMHDLPFVGVDVASDASSVGSGMALSSSEALDTALEKTLSMFEAARTSMPVAAAAPAPKPRALPRPSKGPHQRSSPAPPPPRQTQSSVTVPAPHIGRRDTEVLPDEVAISLDGDRFADRDIGFVVPPDSQRVDESSFQDARIDPATGWRSPGLDAAGMRNAFLQSRNNVSSLRSIMGLEGLEAHRVPGSTPQLGNPLSASSTPSLPLTDAHSFGGRARASPAMASPSPSGLLTPQLVGNVESPTENNGSHTSDAVITVARSSSFEEGAIPRRPATANAPVSSRAGSRNGTQFTRTKPASGHSSRVGSPLLPIEQQRQLLLLKQRQLATPSPSNMFPVAGTPSSLTSASFLKERDRQHDFGDAGSVTSAGSYFSNGLHTNSNWIGTGLATGEGPSLYAAHLRARLEGGQRSPSQHVHPHPLRNADPSPIGHLEPDVNPASIMGNIRAHSHQEGIFTDATHSALAINSGSKGNGIHSSEYDPDTSGFADAGAYPESDPYYYHGGDHFSVANAQGSSAIPVDSSVFLDISVHSPSPSYGVNRATSTSQLAGPKSPKPFSGSPRHRRSPVSMSSFEPLRIIGKGSYGRVSTAHGHYRSFVFFLFLSVPFLLFFFFFFSFCSAGRFGVASLSNLFCTFFLLCRRSMVAVTSVG